MPASTPTPIPPALIVQGGVPMADSRDVAAFFKKRHDNVLRSIDILIADEPETLLNFEEGVTTLVATGSQKHRRFLMNRDGYTLLAMGFTGKRALKFKLAYIAAFNAMEARLNQLAEQDRESPFAAPVSTIGVSEDVLNQKLRELCTWLRDKAFAPIVHEAARDLERRFSAKIDAIAGIGGEDKTISDVVWHAKNSLLKQLKDERTWIDAGVLPAPVRTTASAYKTATQVCWMVVEDAQMHPRLPAIVSRRLLDRARSQLWPQGQTEVRSRFDRASPTFPVDRVNAWLLAEGNNYIRTENDRLHGRASNVVAIRA